MGEPSPQFQATLIISMDKWFVWLVHLWLVAIGSVWLKLLSLMWLVGWTYLWLLHMFSLHKERSCDCPVPDKDKCYKPVLLKGCKGHSAILCWQRITCRSSANKSQLVIWWWYTVITESSKVFRSPRLNSSESKEYYCLELQNLMYYT